VLIRGDDVAYTGGGSPLVAANASSLADATNVGILDTTSVNAAIAEAEKRWIASGLVSAQAVRALGDIQVRIADLQGLTLGLANEAEHSIIIDGNAAGYGWYVDPTLTSDAEFASRVSADESAATAGSPAVGHMDLLTVVEHEVGHLLGMEHGSSDVMNEALEAGLRITPRAASTLPFTLAAMEDAPSTILHVAPVIDWNGGLSVQNKRKVVPGSDPHWYGDFVNHLGQSAAERNPNAEVRVHLPTVRKTAPTVSML
jgi:hypothetical protein